MNIFIIYILLGVVFKSYLNASYVNCMIVYNDKIYIGTEGGVAIFDPSKKEFTTLTNIDGLLGNNIISIACDSNKNILYGVHGAGLCVNKNTYWEYYTESQGFSLSAISSICATHKNIFVGLESSKYGLWVKSTAGEILLEVPGDSVKFMLTKENYIFLTTPVGLVYIHEDSLSQENWHIINLSKLNRFIIKEDTVIFATDSIVGEIYRDSIIKETSLVMEDFARDDTGYIYGISNNGIYKRKTFWRKISDLKGHRLIFYNKLWVGTKGDGIADFETNEKFSPPGPVSNYTNGCAVDPYGNVYFIHRNISTISKFDGKTWQKISLPGVHELNTIVADSRGNKWIGIWNPSESKLKFFQITKTDSIILHKFDEPACVAGLQIVSDTLYILDWCNNTIYKLYNDTELVPFIIDISKPTGIIKDKKGTLWVSGVVDGLYKYKNGIREHIEEISARINGLFLDLNDRLWVATNAGTYMIEEDKIINYGLNNGLLGDDICGFAEDVYGNVWVLQNYGGVSCITYKGEITNYSIKDGLVSVNFEKSDIIANVMSFDYNTGILWIATKEGISAVQTESAPPEPPEIKIFPNPVNLRETNHVTFFSNGLEYVNIYSITGRFITRVDAFNGRAVWYPRVATGIYVFQARIGGKIYSDKVCVIK